MSCIDVHLITAEGIAERSVEGLTELLAGNDGVVWVDIVDCDADAVRALSSVFAFHPLAVKDCAERNRVPKVHAYTDHVFVVLHAPERGERGHVHYVELDQFIGPNYLVTVHGPINRRSIRPSRPARPVRCSTGSRPGGFARRRHGNCPT